MCSLLDRICCLRKYFSTFIEFQRFLLIFVIQILIMDALWNDFNLTEKILLGIGLLFTLIFLLQLIMSLFGADHDADSDAGGDADASVDNDAGIPFQFITLKNLVSFFAIFGWAGLLCMRSNMAPWLSILVAVLAGLAMMTIMAALVYYMSKLADDGTIDSSKAIGVTGDVYLIIPAKRSAQGKIHVKVQGRLVEYQAVTDDVADIPTGSVIRVTGKLSDEVFIVTKI